MGAVRLQLIDNKPGNNADGAEDELHRERIGGRENQQSDANGDAGQVDVTANKDVAADDCASGIDGKIVKGANGADETFDHDTEEDDEDSAAEGDLVDEGVGITQEVEHAGGEQEDVGAVLNLGDVGAAKAGLVVGIGPLTGAGAVGGVAELGEDEDPERSVAKTLENCHEEKG